MNSLKEHLYSWAFFTCIKLMYCPPNCSSVKIISNHPPSASIIRFFMTTKATTCYCVFTYSLCFCSDLGYITNFEWFKSSLTFIDDTVHNRFTITPYLVYHCLNDGVHWRSNGLVLKKNSLNSVAASCLPYAFHDHSHIQNECAHEVKVLRC